MLLAALLASQATPQGVAERNARELAAMLAGRWNNAEAVYFAGELGDEAPPDAVFAIEEADDGLRIERTVAGERVPPLRLSFEADPSGTVFATLDPYAGAPCELRADRVPGGFQLMAVAGPCVHVAYTDEPFIAVAGDAMTWPDGLNPPGLGTLRPADPYACWVSRKKDGGDDAWTWTPDLTLREGEYVQLPDDPAATRPVGLRLRHVRWPYGRNRDSLVLYVHEAQDAPAVSYAWTEPDADRIAVNLRWVQASCTRDEGSEP